ncbi:MAG: sugar nucleotide-binding protein [Candidatus Daviesbacteria bacterium]|nr:sugar nucleotide-binding protein [Candidatus Daviesbacteria bacterium]
MIKLPDEWLVIGSGSLTGSRFIALTKGSKLYGSGGGLDAPNPDLIDFYQLDVTNEAQVEEIIGKFPGKYVINFAGATLVDEIEKTRPQDPTNPEELNQNLAYKVNVLGTRYIAAACRRFGKFPVFISTGFVFDGKNGLYNEESAVAQDSAEVSWYGWTKILAEKEVAVSGVESVTMRISYPYRSEYEGKGDFGRNFLNLYDAVQKGEKQWYPIFIDQTLTPTFIDDLPPAVLTLVENQATGIYHVTSSEVTTPYEFCCEALRVARGVENPESIVPKGTLVDFEETHPNSAKRPLHGGEKTNKIQALSFTPTTWRDGIKRAFGK